VISVVVPTIAGREDYLSAAKCAYAAHTDDYELIIVEGHPVCGSAWVEGAARSRGDFIHFSADDLRPHEGWAVAARDVVSRGFLPAPRILNDDASVQSCGGSDGWETEHPTGRATDFSRIPFLTRELWERIAPAVSPFLAAAHYYTDNAISVAAQTLGVQTGIHRDYLFTHSLAEPGRGAGMTWGQRMYADEMRFRAWLANL
jgi:hypothetical protein